MANAVYAGSFDMFTNGHLDVIEQAVRIFDNIIILVQNNPTKKRTYTVQSCINFIALSFLGKDYEDKISIYSSDVPASLYAKEHDCEFVIRGLRNTSDYLYEEKIANFYKSVCPDVDLIYFKSKYDTVSSSLVKGLLRCGMNPADVANRYLPFADISALRFQYWEGVVSNDYRNNR